jgi:hypothetical protein
MMILLLLFLQKQSLVDGFTGLTQPLTDLLREGQFEYPMPPAAQAAFFELRSCLSRVPLLKYFDPRDETELWTDVSGTAVGGAVLQRDTRGNLRPVAYYSHSSSPSEEKYSTYQRELLAIRDCLLAFRFYLVGCKTDHCSLQWLTEQAEMSPMQSQWYTVFLEYHIKEIQYSRAKRMPSLTPCPDILTPHRNSSTIWYPRSTWTLLVSMGSPLPWPRLTIVGFTSCRRPRTCSEPAPSCSQLLPLIVPSCRCGDSSQTCPNSRPYH